MITPSAPYDHAQRHADQSVAQLIDWLRIPSVSADVTHHATDVQRAAIWLRDALLAAGCTRADVMPTPGHPIVYGEWLGAGDAAPTVLIYGHYDVQPADMKDGWGTPPFEPVIRDGQLYARGASDDKGQTFANIKAVEALLATGTCPANIKFLIEGEEEVSSANIGPFVNANIDMLRADVVLVSDSAILAPGQPSLVTSLRGISYFELFVQGPTSDLHSGTYGGAVHNPAQAIAEIIAALHHPDGRVAVPGFYDDVRPLSNEDRAAIAATGKADAQLIAETGVPAPWGEADHTIAERTGARPTLEVHGIESGFYGEGAKTVLPARAQAKLSCRLVADQDPHRIFALVRDHILSIAPPTVRVQVRFHSGGHPALVDIQHPAVAAAAAAYEHAWGVPPLYQRGGGSIPVVPTLQTALNAPVILMGYGLNTDGLHGPNEHFAIDHFHKGVHACITFMHALAAQHTTAHPLA